MASSPKPAGTPESSGGQSIFRAAPWFWIIGAVLTALICYASYATLKGFFGQTVFTGWHFAAYALALEAVNIQFLLAAWHYRKRFKPAYQVALLEWSGLSIWFWTAAPLYQFTTLMLDSSQLQLDAFIYFWEVPVIGVVAVLFGHWSFRPVAHYLETGYTPDPAALLRRLYWLPRNVAIRALVFTIIGYAAGSWQLYALAGLPPSEAYKNIGNGVVLSLLLALFYGLVYSRFLGGIIAKLRGQYRLPLQRQLFGRSVALTTTLIIASSLCALILLYVQSFQLVVEDHIGNQARDSIRTAIAEAAATGRSLNAADMKQMIIGDRGQSWVKPQFQSLPLAEVTNVTRALYDGRTSGRIVDLHEQIKLIVFETYGDSKVGTVVYVADFYDDLRRAALLVVFVAVIVGLLSISATMIFSRILGRSVSDLIRAVDEAQDTGQYRRPNITSGDEFQSLSEAFEAFITQAHDQTDRAKQERARLEASIDALKQGFVITDSASKIIARNSAVVTTLGARSTAAKNLGDLARALAHEDAKRLEQIAGCILDGSASQQEWEMTTADHKILRLFMAPVADANRVLGVVLLMEDITEDVVADRSRDEFFSIASHELRTPLTAIRGNASMILSYYQQELRNPELQGMIRDMHESSVRLIQIVNDFLDLSRLEQGRMKYHIADFVAAEVAQEVVQDLQTIAAKKRITIALEHSSDGTLPIVRADRDRMKQVVYNLVGNAVKFTETGGITVRLRTKAKLLEVQVADTGGGIDADDQHYLFRKFQQANSSLITRNAAGGTGLGLYISKQLVEEMGGHLRLDHSSASGTQFSFTLPLARPDKPLPAKVVEVASVPQVVKPARVRRATLTQATKRAPRRSA